MKSNVAKKVHIEKKNTENKVNNYQRIKHEKGANLNQIYTFLFIVIVVVSFQSLMHIRRIYFFIIHVSALWNRLQYYSFVCFKE